MLSFGSGQYTAGPNSTDLSVCNRLPIFLYLLASKRCGLLRDWFDAFSCRNCVLEHFYQRRYVVSTLEEDVHNKARAMSCVKCY